MLKSKEVLEKLNQMFSEINTDASDPEAPRIWAQASHSGEGRHLLPISKVVFLGDVIDAKTSPPEAAEDDIVIVFDVPHVS